MNLKSVSEIEHIEGKRIILRSDCNEPIENGVVRDTYRIMRALPTIQFLTSRGAKVILITHLGDDGSQDLSPIVKVLEENKVPLAYVRSADMGTIQKVAAEIQNGNVLLLPNIRAFAGEKENDVAFSKWLASLGDAYVNDAFSVSHREHASIVGIPKILPSYAGMQLLEEIEHLSAMSNNPERPFVVMFGGAKLSTKLPLIEKLSKKADKTVVGGALLNQILFSRGMEIGQSLHDENEKVDASIFASENMIIPNDVVVKRGLESVTVGINEVEANDVIVDIGIKSVGAIEAALLEAKTVLWNGPMGKYEEGYGGATEALLNKLAALNATTKTTVGGGDTVTLVSKLGLQDKLHFISTGGGATLDYLEKGTLPGIQALES
jgi:phosphoglycerate kinase